MKKASKVEDFCKTEEIFIPSLAALSAQKSESCTTKSIFMQDWVP